MRKINRGQKERRRHRYQKALTRKPNFKEMLAKNMMVAILIAVLVCVVGLLISEQVYVGSKQNQTYEIINTSQYYIEGLHEILYGGGYDEEGNAYKLAEDAELTDITINSLNCMLDEMSVDMNCYMALYDDKGGSLIADASENIYMVNRAGEVSSFLRFQYATYVLDVEQIEKSYPGLMEEIEAKVTALNEASSDVYYCTSDGVGQYYKAGYVIPEAIKIYCSSNDISGWSLSDRVVETYDLSEVDTTGYRYEYIPLEELLLRTYYFKSGYTSDHIQYQYYNQNIKSVYDVRVEQELTTFGTKIIYCETVQFGEKPMTLVVSGTYNLFDEYGNEIVIGCCLLLLCLMGISILVSYVIYLRKKERYEIEMYRRNTTNAMAHDLKSPLMAISAYAENLINGENPEKNQYYSESILETVNYMDQVIANILNLSKIENGSLRLNKEWVGLKGLVEEHLPKYELLMRERGVQISITGYCTQECDRVWMTQMVDNLVSNAVKYAKKNSTIELQLTENALTIENLFEGELDKQPEELTESFVKGDNARSDNQGTGIGLAIVKNVAEVHGFDLELTVKNGRFVAKVIFSK